MKKTLKQNLYLILFLLVMILPYFLFAQSAYGKADPLNNMKTVAEGGGYDSVKNETAMAKYIGSVVKIALSLLGLIFLILILIAGYNYLTAGGDESKVKKALSTIKNAIIGLIILVASWAIYEFIFSRLIQ